MANKSHSTVRDRTRVRQRPVPRSTETPPPAQAAHRQDNQAPKKPPRPSKTKRAAKPRQSPVKQPAATSMRREAVARNKLQAAHNDQTGSKSAADKSHGGARRALGVIAGLIVLLIVLNALAPTGLVEFTENLFAGFGGSGKFPATQSPSVMQDLALCGKDVAVLNDSVITLYKPDGGQVYKRQHGYGNPAMSVSANRVLVYDRGGHALRVENRARTLNEMQIDYGIITADIGNSGAFALACRSDKYICDVEIFNNDFEKIFLWHSSQQVCALSIAANGKYVAVGTLSVSSGEYVSTVLIFDVRKAEPLLRKEYPGSALLSLDYKSSGVVGVFDDRAVFINAKGEIRQRPFAGDRLNHYDNSNRGGLALVFSQYNDAHNTRLETFDDRLHLTGTAPIDREVLALSMSRRRTAVLLREQLDVFDPKGTRIHTASVPSDGRLIALSHAKAILLGSTTLYAQKIS